MSVGSFLSVEAAGFFEDLEDGLDSFIVSGANGSFYETTKNVIIEDLGISIPSSIDDFSLEGVTIESMSKTVEKLIVRGKFNEKPTDTCQCGCSNYRKGGKVRRQLTDMPVENLKTQVIIDISVWRCSKCGMKNTILPSSILPKKRLTKRAIVYIGSNIEIGKTNGQIADHFGIDESTVRAIKKESNESLWI